MARLMLYLPVGVLFCINEIQFVYAGSNESRVIFDQRQTGKYNIHVSIKDVAIIELDRNDFRETNSDPDYYYDESDFTIKPLLAWYQSLNATKNPSTTEATDIASFNNTPVILNSTSIIHTTTLTTTPTKEATTVSSQTQSPKSTTSKKPSSVVILGSESELVPTKPQNNRIGANYDIGGQVPVQVVMEPVLHPKFRAPQLFPFKIGQGRVRPSASIGNGNSRIFNFKARKASQQDPPKKQVRSSILEKLFSMLASFHDDADAVDE